MEKVTLGGDRLGSGNKLKVDLKEYQRSTHDLSYLWRSSMSAGTLVPFMHLVALPNDTFDIDLDCQVMTHPTVGPLFGSFKVQLDVFQVPMRIYLPPIQNDLMGVAMDMYSVELPYITLKALKVPITNGDTTNYSTSQINPSCILSYLGIRGVGYTSVDTKPTRDFNGIPFLAYWDIFKNYYSNKQEDNAYVIHTNPTNLVQDITNITVLGNPLPANVTPGVPITVYSPAAIDPIKVTFRTDQGDFILKDIAVGRGYSGGNEAFTVKSPYNLILKSWYYTSYANANVKPTLTPFALSTIDDMRTIINQQSALNAGFDIRNEATPLGTNPYSLLLADAPVSSTYYQFSQEGLAVKTYNSDLFNNWISVANYNKITNAGKITTGAGYIQMSQLTVAEKLWELTNQLAAAGNTYDNWLQAVYNAKRIKQANTPIYLGSLIRELAFQEVVSNNETAVNSSTKPIGTLAGKGVLTNKRVGGKIIVHVDEPSYIMGIVSLTPRVDYSQGNSWDTSLKTYDDFHKPALDQIGMQELIAEQMAWNTTTWYDPSSTWIQQKIGYQPSWTHYMTAVNETHGNFAIATNEMFMTLNRNYHTSGGNGSTITDLTTYIDPVKFNQIFAQTSLDAQNFWVQISNNITARRLMSAKQMPTI